MLNDNIVDVLNSIKHYLKLISPVYFYIFNVATRNFQISCGSHLWLSYFFLTVLLPTKTKRIFLKHKYELVTRLLKTFQWLIIAFRIKFILLHVVFKPRPSLTLQPYLSQPSLSTCPLHKHTPFVVETHTPGPCTLEPPVTFSQLGRTSVPLTPLETLLPWAVPCGVSDPKGVQHRKGG